MKFPFSLFQNQKKSDRQEREYERGCAFCEHATIRFTGEKRTVVCQKKKRQVNAASECELFSYDLLKRAPRRMKMPVIDPEALDD